MIKSLQYDVDKFVLPNNITLVSTNFQGSGDTIIQIKRSKLSNFALLVREGYVDSIVAYTKEKFVQYSSDLYVNPKNVTLISTNFNDTNEIVFFVDSDAMHRKEDEKKGFRKTKKEDPLPLKDIPFTVKPAYWGSFCEHFGIVLPSDEPSRT